MSENSSLLQDGVDRFNDAVRSIDHEVQRIQKRVDSNRRKLEKRTRSEVKRLQTEFQKNDVVKRADALRTDVVKQLEQRVDDVRSALGIASRDDLERVDRKLNSINKKLRDLESPKKSAGRTATA